MAQVVSCTPARSASSDSQKLRAVQLGLTKTVAANSGAAITGAIDGAISDAFSASGGSPINAGPSGARFNFAAEPQSDVARRTDQAFSALGYAGDITKAPPRVPDRDWSLWTDVRGTGFDQNDALAPTHGNQVNVTGGIGYKLAPDLLAGVFTGYEHFNYTVESLSGKLSGDGGTVGAYAAYRFAPHWRVDGALGWTDVAYAARAGTAAGSLKGSRWLATGALTGDYRYGGFLLEPSARIYALWESENAYTDSLGTLQAARNFSEGRVAAGGKVIYPWQATSDLLVSPYVGLYDDYRFSSDTALPVGIAFVGIKDGWSERVTGGLTMKSGLAGPSLSLGAELGGLGAGYDLWSANARMNWPF
jgi:Autotransporter beta-domain